MAEDFEFLSPDDKPALLALTTPELLASVQAALLELGYKVHVAADHEDFSRRFAQVTYQVVVFEECFACALPEENVALQAFQSMQMVLRRHVTSFLIGMSFQSLNTMQAYQQSVHAVINPGDLSTLAQIIQKYVADNDLFMHAYRDTQRIIAQGKA